MNHDNRHVVFVPGMNPKPPPADHQRLLWRCIAVGAAQAQVAAEQLAPLGTHFHLAAWNYIYYGHYADIEQDRPWVEHMLRGAGTQYCAPEASRWAVLSTRAKYTLGDLLPVLARLAGDTDILARIADTERYFSNRDGIGTRVRAAIKQTLAPLVAQNAEIMLVGHSLGSVLAYDTLWELSRRDAWPWRCPLLLTLGSPLGMYYVQRRLLGRREHGARRYPGNIRRWINLTATGDVIATDRRLANDFGRMRRLGLVDSIEDIAAGVHTCYGTAEGPAPHRCFGYFFHPRVAGLITNWLHRREPRAV
ncbi:MAG TPA: hypothetical protein VJS89_07205 [Gammaproteobacteria bacterium]|nr:hypothetical protein [Gammaproteobacteria bacterium]